jgi:hypothetical protein
MLNTKTKRKKKEGKIFSNFVCSKKENKTNINIEIIIIVVVNPSFQKYIINLDIYIYIHIFSLFLNK